MATASNRTDHVTRVAARFAPQANKTLYAAAGSPPEVDVLVATDVLAEGLNLQDSNQLINYDLHWNPVRLIQRAGRVDRLGSEAERIYVRNFLPTRAGEEHLGLEECLQRRIAEIHELVGEDAPVLRPEEQLNEQGMLTVYGDPKRAPALEEEEESLLDSPWDEVESMLRGLQETDPNEYQRIVALPDGIRCGKWADEEGLMVALADEQGYVRAHVYDTDGSERVLGVRELLKRVETTREESAAPLPDWYRDRLQTAVGKAELIYRRSAQSQGEVQQTAERRWAREELTRLRPEDAEPQTVERLYELVGGPLSSQQLARLRQLKTSRTTPAGLVDELEEWLAVLPGLAEAGVGEGQAVVAGAPFVLCSEALVEKGHDA